MHLLATLLPANNTTNTAALLPAALMQLCPPRGCLLLRSNAAFVHLLAILLPARLLPAATPTLLAAHPGIDRAAIGAQACQAHATPSTNNKSVAASTVPLTATAAAAATNNTTNNTTISRSPIQANGCNNIISHS